VTAAYYLDWMQILCRKMHKNRPDLLRDGPLILHNNAHPHLGKVVTDLLRKYEREVLPHAPNSPDLLSTGLQLIPQVKRSHAWTPFSLPEEVSAGVTCTIPGLNKIGALNGIAHLPKHWDTVTEKQEDYIEGL